MKMNKIVVSIFTIGIGLGSSMIAYSAKSNDYEHSNNTGNSYMDGGYSHFYPGHGPYHKGKFSKRNLRLVLNLVGTGEMYESFVPDIDGDQQKDPAVCFDIGLEDASTGLVIGTATDCLSNIDDGDNGGLKLVGTTFFNLPYGKIVTRGLTTVQPVNEQTITPDGIEMTHITGASSDENGVLKARGAYRHFTGKVRLSGLVNLSLFGGQVGDPITFDCLFTIDLEGGKRAWPHHYELYGKE